MAVPFGEEKLALNDAVQTLTHVLRRMADGGACYAGMDTSAPGRVLSRADCAAVYVLRFSKHDTSAVLHALAQLADLLQLLHDVGLCYTHTEQAEEHNKLNDDEREALRVLLGFVEEGESAQS